MRLRQFPGASISVSAILVGFILASNGCSSLTVTGFSGAEPYVPLTSAEMKLEDNLRRHVQTLAGEIGERNRKHPAAYRRAVDYIANEFECAGYAPTLLDPRNIKGITIENIEVESRGTIRPSEILVIGAHLDTEEDCPGANDNGSGVAALLEIARLCKHHPMARTVRFIAFYDEEYFGFRPMGSQIYSSDCRRRGDNVVGMLSLETIGYYSDAPRSQHYPLPLLLGRHRSKGDFVAFVGDSKSHELISELMTSFTNHTKFPCAGMAAPWYVAAASRSDQLSFWREDYRGCMVTDTASYRYPYYHDAQDTPEKLDYQRMTRVVSGLVQVVQDLGNSTHDGIGRKADALSVPWSSQEKSLSWLLSNCACGGAIE